MALMSPSDFKNLVEKESKSFFKDPFEWFLNGFLILAILIGVILFLNWKNLIFSFVLENSMTLLLMLAIFSLIVVFSKNLLNKEKAGPVWKDLRKIIIVFGALFVIIFLFEKNQTASKEKIFILVANFENDNSLIDSNESSVKSIVMADLKKQMPFDQIISLNETLKIIGPVYGDALKTENEKAQSILKKNGCDLLIWGKVGKRDGKTSVDVFLNSASENKTISQEKEYEIKDVHLGNVFATDVGVLLKLVLFLRAQEIFAKENYYVADQAKALLERAKSIFDNVDLAKTNRVQYLQVQIIKAQLLSLLGQQVSDSDAIAESISIYKNALRNTPSKLTSFQISCIKTNCANALCFLGEKNSDRELLKEGLGDYDEALKCLDLAKNPLIWGSIELNKADCLISLGQFQDDKNYFHKVRSILGDVLKIVKREKYPIAWALVKSDYAKILDDAGTSDRDPIKLQEAIQIYKEVDEVLNVNNAPLQWAYTKINYADSLINMWKIEGVNSFSDEAIKNEKEAIEVYSPEKMPINWANAQNNLGCILQSIGLAQNDKKKIKESMDCYERSADEALKQNNQPLYYCAECNLGNLQREFGEKEGNEIEYLRSIKTYKAILERRDLTDVNIKWSLSLVGLATALAQYGNYKKDYEILKQSLDTFEKALEMAKNEGNKKSPLGIKINLACALLNIGELKSENKYFDRAQKIFKELEPECKKIPDYLALVKNNLEFIKSYKEELKTAQQFLPVKPSNCPDPIKIN